jgi:hypothetical protein
MPSIEKVLSGDFPFVLLIVYITGCVATGSFLTWPIELPMLRMRDRLYPARTSCGRQRLHEGGVALGRRNTVDCDLANIPREQI